MKFSDIPKFTKTPPYHSDIPLGNFEDWLNTAINELHLQLNPDFQRGHVWTKEQQIAYVEFILRGGKTGRDLYFNHPAWLRSFKGEFVCVDGLQRITAIIRFIHNEIPVFGHYIREFEDSIRMADVNLSVWINDLKSRKSVLVWYLEMNSGGTPHTKQELDKVRKMIDNYDDKNKNTV